MDWITHELPKESGPYLFAGQIKTDGPTTVFNYVAYFNKDTHSWHKYDPFAKNEIGDVIPNEYCNAWKEAGGNFIK